MERYSRLYYRKKDTTGILQKVGYSRPFYREKDTAGHITYRRIQQATLQKGGYNRHFQKEGYSRSFYRKKDTAGRIIFFFLYIFWVNQQFIFHNFLLCRPSQRSVFSQVPSQVATHQKIDSQLRAGETPDLNPGLQDNSHASYH
jgi:hypothetical protein